VRKEAGGEKALQGGNCGFFATTLQGFLANLPQMLPPKRRAYFFINNIK
jgi:hypothetical protein